MSALSFNHKGKLDFSKMLVEDASALVKIANSTVPATKRFIDAAGWGNPSGSIYNSYGISGAVLERLKFIYDKAIRRAIPGRIDSWPAPSQFKYQEDNIIWAGVWPKCDRGIMVKYTEAFPGADNLETSNVSSKNGSGYATEPYEYTTFFTRHPERDLPSIISTSKFFIEDDTFEDEEEDDEE